MNILNSYLRSKLDLSPVGFQRGDKESEYFCTPLYSRVLGWAGVDGIHFCKVKGFDEMIFAVNPTYEPGDYVHPVAHNFEDFLRLLLACNDTAAMEQCWFMDREVFDDFLTNNPPTEEMRSCLDAIQKKYKLTPMEDPFAYMQELHQGFDYCLLQFPPEYYEIVPEPVQPKAPEWKVTWDGDFFDMDPETNGVDPVSVQSHFQWAGIDWYVPEVYPFEHGMILYLLGKVDAELVPAMDYQDFLSPEAYERMMAENPLNLAVRPEVYVNDMMLRPSGSTGLTWMPGQDSNLESRWVLEHYGLNLDSAWQINRIRFFWPQCGKLDIHRMTITMIQEQISVSGTHFVTPLHGNSVLLTHPQTGMEYTLHIEALKQEKADFSRLRDEELEYPTCYTQMQFRIEPDLPRRAFRIEDCARSDQPRYKEGYQKPENQAVFAVGIIGGASVPVTLVTRLKEEPSAMLHEAASALHFELADRIEWRIVFHEKPNADLTVPLI